MTLMTVRSAGPRTTVQDHGRTGYAALGVPASGFADPLAASAANQLVGQPGGAPVLETMGGLTLTFDTAVVVAVTGPGVHVQVGGSSAPSWQTVTVPPGLALTVSAPDDGVYAYVGVHGGFNTCSQQVLGSASTCMLSGLGPEALHPGSTLTLGPVDSERPVAAADQPRLHHLLRVLPGPHAHLFPAGTFENLCGYWAVSPMSSRVGVRLSGTSLAVPELPLGSLGMVTGAVQVPPDGQPVVLGPDHGVTGGYPVLAVVVRADLPVIAQAKPGTVLRLYGVTVPPEPAELVLRDLTPIL